MGDDSSSFIQDKMGKALYFSLFLNWIAARRLCETF